MKNMTGKLVRIWKEAVMVYFKILSQKSLKEKKWILSLLPTA
jgi:hypothetical protein